MLFPKITILLCVLFSNTISAESTDVDLLSIGSWNVWFHEASSTERFPNILNHIKNLSPDVMLLQEVTPTFIDQFNTSDLSKNYHLIATPNAKRAYGLAYLSKKPFEFTDIVQLSSKYNRTVFFSLHISASNKAYVFVNVHLESGQSENIARGKQIDNIHSHYLPEFIRKVNTSYPNITIVGSVWGGDFNIDGHESHETLNKNWIDAAVYKNNDKVTYDVINNPLARKTAAWLEGSSRLDRFYLNIESPLTFVQYNVINDFKGQGHAPSDHLPILIQID